MEAQVLVEIVVPMATALLMLVVGTDVVVDKQLRALSTRSVLLCTAAQLAVLPVVAMAVATVAPVGSMVAVGLAVVALVPSGSLSNAYTYLARGNVTLSIALTIVSTFAFTLLFPQVTALASMEPGFRQVVDGITTNTAMLKLVLVLSVPVAAGALIRHLFPERVSRYRRHLERVVSVTVVVTLALSVHAGWDYFVGVFGDILLATVLFTLGAIVAGYVTTRFLAPRDSSAVIIEVSTRNGAAIVLVGQGLMANEAILGFACGFCLIQAALMLAYCHLIRRRVTGPGSRRVADAG